LDFRGSAFGIWQNVIFRSDSNPSLTDPAFKTSETLGAGIASLQYVFDRHAQHSNVFANAIAWASDYSTLPHDPQYGASAGAGISQNVNLTRRMTFRDAATVAYSPYYNFSPTSFASTVGTVGTVGTPSTQAPFVANSTEPSLLTPGFGVAAVKSAN